MHVLLPVHASFEPDPISTSQVLPPPQVTVLFVPVSSVHWLVPVQVEVQFDSQLPAHTDWPSQVLVHPLPHVTSQVPLVSQWYVRSLGSPLAFTLASALAPPLPLPLPKVHLPPVLHEQIVPEQSQSPVHDAATGVADEPPQPAASPVVIATTLNELRNRE